MVLEERRPVRILEPNSSYISGTPDILELEGPKKIMRVRCSSAQGAGSLGETFFARGILCESMRRRSYGPHIADGPSKRSVLSVSPVGRAISMPDWIDLLLAHFPTLLQDPIP